MINFIAYMDSLFENIDAINMNKKSGIMIRAGSPIRREYVYFCFMECTRRLRISAVRPQIIRLS